jgi:NAD(P)-dependent dehydrogenase (short-subunit alcohol dehydrogenase family)
MSTERVAIVTGGSCGVGRDITRRLTLQGYAVVVAYRTDQAAAEAAVEEVLAANGTALAVRADVTDDVDVERLFFETVEAFGGVDVVVHAIRRPADRSDDAVRAVARGFTRALSGRAVTVDTVVYGSDGAAVVADAVASLAGDGGRSLDGHVIEIRTREGPGSSTGARPVGATRSLRRHRATERTLMDVAALAQLLRETSEHHGVFEARAPKHDWWDWYAPYMDARQHGSTPEEASRAADKYMQDVRHVVAR